MPKDLRKQMDQKPSIESSQTTSIRCYRGLKRVKRNRPLTFAFVVALSLALSACGALLGEVKQTYMSLLTLGNDYKKNNDFTNAIDCYNKALKEADTKFGPESGQAATALGYLAQIYRAQGEWRLAYMTYKRLIPLRDKFEPKARETADMKKDFEFVKSKIIEYSIKTDDNFGAEEMKKKEKATTGKKPKKHH